MGDFCIVGYNFGYKYQDFIPIFIYSILKSYPSYNVLVFSDVKLKENVKRNILTLNNKDNFEVIENYSFGLKRKVINLPGSNKALRWLFFDERFLKYKYIYIGDIDIFICHENKSLLDQHLIHMKKLNLCYSNYVRLTSRVEKGSIKYFVKHFFNLNYRNAKYILFKHVENFYRLTGLHFIKVKDYYSKVKPLFNKYINKISNKNNLVEKYLKSDETLLYDLVKESKLGLPPLSPNSPMMEVDDCSSVGFRPHHGIHLGIFRSEKGIMKQSQVISSKLYINYYKYFKNLYLDDLKLKNIIDASDSFVRGIFKKVINFYEKKN